VARHALAGVKARDVGELAFESRSERDAAGEFQNPLALPYAACLTEQRVTSHETAAVLLCAR
jgi:hypothetical protein